METKIVHTEDNASKTMDMHNVHGDLFEMGGRKVSRVRFHPNFKVLTTLSSN